MWETAICCYSRRGTDRCRSFRCAVLLNESPTTLWKELFWEAPLLRHYYRPRGTAEDLVWFTFETSGVFSWPHQDSPDYRGLAPVASCTTILLLDNKFGAFPSSSDPDGSPPSVKLCEWNVQKRKACTEISALLRRCHWKASGGFIRFRKLSPWIGVFGRGRKYYRCPAALLSSFLICSFFTASHFVGAGIFYNFWGVVSEYGRKKTGEGRDGEGESF